MKNQSRDYAAAATAALVFLVTLFGAATLLSIFGDDDAWPVWRIVLAYASEFAVSFGFAALAYRSVARMKRDARERETGGVSNPPPSPP